jgi:hypothetical protein
MLRVAGRFFVCVCEVYINDGLFETHINKKVPTSGTLKILDKLLCMYWELFWSFPLIVVIRHAFVIAVFRQK